VEAGPFDAETGCPLVAGEYHPIAYEFLPRHICDSNYHTERSQATAVTIRCCGYWGASLEIRHAIMWRAFALLAIFLELRAVKLATTTSNDDTVLPGSHARFVVAHSAIFPHIHTLFVLERGTITIGGCGEGHDGWSCSRREEEFALSQAGGETYDQLEACCC
jgi:hypothetical protein